MYGGHRYLLARKSLALFFFAVVASAQIPAPGSGGGSGGGGGGSGTVTSIATTGPIGGGTITTTGTLTCSTCVTSAAALTNNAFMFGGGSQASQTVTAATATAALNQFSASLQGLVPSSGGGTSTFLRADGSWAAPSGSGTVTTTGSPVSGNLTAFSGASSITNSNLSGDVTTAGTLATTLATVNSNTGSCGDATHVCQVTLNGKGLATAASAVAITGSGTVTSIATTGPIGGGTITTTGTLTCSTCVTSAAALTNNAVVIGGGSQASSTISADTTTTHALFATAAAPAFRALAIGDLPTITIAAGGTNATSATAGTVPNATTTTASSWTAAPVLGVDGTTAGSLQLSNSAASAHNILGSGATTTNTIDGFAVVPTTGHLIDCTVTSTTCLLHDSGVVTANVVNASSPGVGIAHFAGSTQTATSSLIVSADITDSTIATGKLASLQGSDTNLMTAGTVSGTGATLCTDASGGATTSGCTSGGSGTVTSVGFTGGLISVATATTTPALTVAGTSGGVVGFTSTSTWASSGAWAAGGIGYGTGAGSVPAATAAGTAGQIVRSGGSSAPTLIDFPDVKNIPAANCNNATAGSGWSIGASGTVTCRAGTNNIGGYISITRTSSSFATFQIAVPEDWDTGSNPYIRFQIASTDATNADTIIPSIQVACYKGDGSTTDDVAANAAHSLSTVTLNGNASRFWSSSNIQMNSTDVTGCVAGALMQITVGRAATDTATNAEFYGATITFPRLITVQAN